MRIAIFSCMLACGLTAAQSAQAQSLPSVGSYMGMNVGYGWGNSTQRDNVIPPPPRVPLPVQDDGSYSVNGGSIGLTAGYGVIVNQVLLGIEGDINWSDIAGSSNVCGGNHVCGTKLDGYGTLRARAGIPLAAATLAYVTGGLVVGRINEVVPVVRTEFPL